MKKYIELLEVLCCPQCKSDLEFVEKYLYEQETEDELLRKIKGQEIQGYKCPKCNLLFPIIEEIPVFLIDKAIKL
ncbi:MAG: Trm112 family protein [bacterium]